MTPAQVRCLCSIGFQAMNLRLEADATSRLLRAGMGKRTRAHG